MLNNLYAEAKEKVLNPVNFCVVGQWGLRLNDEDLEAFMASLNDPDFSSRSLMRLYEQAGATFKLTSLVTHRNGACACR